MMVNVFDLFTVDVLYVLLGLMGATLISLIIAIVAICKAAKMKKKYNEFMGTSSGEDIESIIKKSLGDMDSLKKISKKNTESVKDIYEKMQFSFQKIGIIKYDAFHEMGGKLSFALCLLDKENTGCVVNVMHSNTGCFAYIKEIVGGKSYIELGDEEQEALDQATAGRMGDSELSQKINDMIQKDKV